MKTLVVVDFQRDFYHPNGTMYVKGAEDAEDAIVNYINEHASELTDAIFTVDWHSPNHCSFIRNNGEWPVHCVQFTEGAGINEKIFFTCVNKNIPVKVFKKGNVDDTEEYGAFQYMWNDLGGLRSANESGKESICINSTDLVVCGIAGDYCVKETLTNLINHSAKYNINIEVLRDGVVSIDGGKIFNEYIKENNLKVV